ncbi:uncharacterized protein LOC131015305 [Salvia miltiorrhiza]|uniref:uncharacterized protein LOC131015305 n=1 Tax=Salvia miltiorrhiza TaxID=226208 RepID=UPI0025AD1D78|nr:uncharacterized protein LOC131015305 [Salvia miltiorrhiza]
MSTALISKRATITIGKSSDLFRTSFAFLRGLSTTTSSAADTEKPKRKKKKKKNLFEVAQFLPNWGIGYHMAKTHWAEVSYEITKINLYKDGRHGKAWGIAHKNGTPAADAPKKISGVHKALLEIYPHVKKNRRKCAKTEEDGNFVTIFSLFVGTRCRSNS